MKYLIHITLGNIQGFIGAARRTRDLWFGSFVLSELSKAAALHLDATQKGCLVFPCPRSAGAAGEPAPLTLMDEAFSVANVVAVLECADKGACATLLRDAKLAVGEKWQAFALEAQAHICNASAAGGNRRRVKSADASAFLRPDVWDAQLDEVVDYIAAAVPLADDTHESYAAASARLDSLLAARKQTHVFRQYAERSSPRLGLPKSSLDGAQSTVIVEATPANSKLVARTRRRMGIEAAEQLDAAGLVKRVIGRKRAFVPVARVASELWLAMAEKQLPEEFGALVGAYDAACDGDVADFLGTDLGPWTSERYPWTTKFRYDAQLLYPPRIEAALIAAVRAVETDAEAYGGRARAQSDESRIASMRELADNLRNALLPLWRKLGSPQPYYAMVYADGDRMGKLIRASARFGAARQRAVSQALSAFAQQVPTILNTHSGACIYAGGDDVLALVGLDQALPCAEALQKAFAHAMRASAEACGIIGSTAPTLRVGMAIAHYLMPLADVRDAAKRAGEIAKLGYDATKPMPSAQQGNALGIWLQPRSGVGLGVRVPWQDQAAVTRLKEQVAMLQGSARMPAGLPVELDDLYRSMAQTRALRPRDAASSDTRAPLFVAAAKALLAKKRLPEGKPMAADDQAKVLDWLSLGVSADDEQADQPWVDIGERCHGLVAARWLAGHTEEVGES